ncbi:MAG: hypothetical protein JRF72_19155 [Deltaproteobacteria bacterium]|jgi:hypothetical protein|nr:hypothetical protein [Deltaproteobacteria bacterium]
MLYHQKYITWFAGLMFCLLAATAFINCSGGGNEVAGGGIGGTGIVIGAVSGIGSITVNEGQLDTGNAEVIIEGNFVGVGDQAVRDFLEIGMVVRVETVSRADGTAAADRIFYNDDVEGPVQEITTIDNLTKKLTVMGQTVVVNDLTVFKNTAIGLIALDNVLEISGFVDSEGFIRAAFVEKTVDVILPDTAVELKGIVFNLNSLQETFQINQLTIDYSLADVSSLPAGLPSEGQLVEVKGKLDGNAVLIADRIEPENLLGTDDSGKAEIQGIVSSFASVSDFDLGGVEIQTDAATAFEGLDPEELDIESKLLVKGSLSNGVLLADRVIDKDKVKLKSGVKLKGSQTLTLEGLEVIVRSNSLTKFLGDADSFDQISIGDDVRIFGRPVTDNANNNALASKVMTKSSADSKIMLKGPVSQVNSPTLIILGTTVDTTTVPEDGFELSDGSPITRGKFFSIVGEGDIVNAKGTLNGTVTWTGIELQTDN